MAAVQLALDLGTAAAPPTWADVRPGQRLAWHGHITSAADRQYIDTGDVRATVVRVDPQPRWTDRGGPWVRIVYVPDHAGRWPTEAMFRPASEPLAATSVVAL